MRALPWSGSGGGCRPAGPAILRRDDADLGLDRRDLGPTDNPCFPGRCGVLYSGHGDDRSRGAGGDPHRNGLSYRWRCGRGYGAGRGRKDVHHGCDAPVRRGEQHAAGHGVRRGAHASGVVHRGSGDRGGCHIGRRDVRRHLSDLGLYGLTFDATTGAGAPAGVLIGQPTYTLIPGTATGMVVAAGVTFQTTASFIAAPANVVTGPGTASGATLTALVSFEPGRARGQGWAKLPEGASTWTNVAKPGDGWTVVPSPGGSWDKVA